MYESQMDVDESDESPEPNSSTVQGVDSNSIFIASQKG